MNIQFLHSERLVIDYWHPASQHSGVLRIVGTGRFVNVSTLREDPESRIITDSPELICRILGIEYPDSQVTKR